MTHTITSSDINDGHGHSHKSQVKYTKHLNPFIVDIEFVKFGGRAPNKTCYTNEYWKHYKTRWYRWYPNGWGIVAEEGAGNWLPSSGNTISFPYLIGDPIEIYTGAEVSNQLMYTEDFNCWEGVNAVSYVGEKHWHLME